MGGTGARILTGQLSPDELCDFDADVFFQEAARASMEGRWREADLLRLEAIRREWAAYAPDLPESEPVAPAGPWIKSEADYRQRCWELLNGRRVAGSGFPRLS